MAVQDQATLGATDIMRQLKALQNQMKKLLEQPQQPNNKRERGLGEIPNRGGEEEEEEEEEGEKA